MSRRSERAALAAITSLLTACAAMTPDAALQSADEAAQREAGVSLALSPVEQREAAARDRLSEGPLAVDDAVRLALSSSAAVQALLHGSVATQNRLSREGALGDLRLGFERTSRTGDVEMTRVLGIGLIELVTWPMRHRMARDAIEVERCQLATDVLLAAHRARVAWMQAVASRQRLVYLEQVAEVAEAAGEMAKRMHAAGNWSRLQVSRQQVFAANAAAELERARSAATRDRELLVRALGLSEADAARLTLPERLPDLPAAPRPDDDVAAEAGRDRLDLAVAERRWQLARRAHRLADTTSGVDADLSAVHTRETALPLKKGWELEFAIPLADLGSARRQASSAEELAALTALEQVQRDAGSLLRERLAAYRHAHRLARQQRDVVMPLARTIAEESRLAYNGMLVGTFEMLADAQAQIRAVMAALDAERDFWLADAALRAAIRGVPASGTQPGIRASSLATEQS